MDRDYRYKYNRENFRDRYKINNKISLQDAFFEAAIQGSVEVEIFMKNESVRKGYIAAYDNWCVLVWDGKQQYLVFKSGIMSIRPSENLKSSLNDLYEPNSRFAFIAEREAKYN